ncbi:hypothetical protein RGQ29_002747 [Quercus rubra]|uniref:F-box protein n=1 Tax=Quercus rubra TaxID=3512 RepID=A0AAN7IA84_QUERU|nr:hypothetical protein RGQ29_002747 [Quercus rubra]KAK4566602.1 hypothetical protein RGQ29_002747 [Quercus rubra]
MGRKSKSHSDPTTSMTKKKAKAVKGDEKVGGTDIISKLHPNIVTDILSRLPFNTVLSCRCVCKTWLHLLVDPSFAQLYHTRAHPCIILQPTYRHRNQHLYAVHFDNRNREFVIIKHKPGINLTSFNACLCLGFCPKTQVYKVVRLLKQQYGVEVSNSMLTHVYTLGEKGNGLWKSVNVGESLLDQPTDTIFLNGIIHWVVRSDSGPQFIYSFDVEDECFRPVPPPPEFVSSEQTMRSRWTISLGVLEGCLAIGECAKDAYFHIWVMKDYGVQASWTKAYTIGFTMVTSYSHL